MDLESWRNFPTQTSPWCNHREGSSRAQPLQPHWDEQISLGNLLYPTARSRHRLTWGCAAPPSYLRFTVPGLQHHLALVFPLLLQLSKALSGIQRSFFLTICTSLTYALTDFKFPILSKIVINTYVFVSILRKLREAKNCCYGTSSNESSSFHCLLKCHLLLEEKKIKINWQFYHVRIWYTQNRPFEETNDNVVTSWNLGWQCLN